MSKQDLILLYGGRSAERKVSVLSAESVMRAIDYQAFSVQTYFITQSGDFIQTQAFEEKPADDEKLMTNDTVDWSKKSGTISDLQGRGGCFSGTSRTNGGRWFHSRLLRSLEDALCWLWHLGF